MFKVEKPEYMNETFRIDKKLLEKLEAIARKLRSAGIDGYLFS